MRDYPGSGPVPVVIVIGGQVLRGWTSMQLQRTKEGMTGSLTVEIFFGFVPQSPQLRAAKAGAKIQVYIGGHLAFTGTTDKRKGKGTKGPASRGADGKFTSPPSGGGTGIKASIGPNNYRITLTARGKTKDMIDSSHSHKTGSIKKAKTKRFVEAIAKPFKIPLEWRAPDLEMGTARLRDGAIAQREIDRACRDFGYFRYETRDGKLRVTDQAGPEYGEPLILGRNILEFDAEQSEDMGHSDIRVKGQRTQKEIWGREAVNRFKTMKQRFQKRHRPITVQNEFDASDEALERRAQHETNKRTSASKEVRVKVFHVMPESGQPWDIGKLHYVEVLTEGVATVLECTGLTYRVDDERTLTTELKLNPPPKGKGNAMATGGGLGQAPVATGLTALVAPLAVAASVASRVADWMQIGAARLVQAGITISEQQYPEPWEVADLSDVPSDDALFDDDIPVLAFDPDDDVPLQLPEHLNAGS